MNTLSHHRPLQLQSSRRLASRLRGLIATLRQTIRSWIERDRSRRELRELDERLLKDIGVSRAEAEHIGNKPFWRE